MITIPGNSNDKKCNGIHNNDNNHNFHKNRYEQADIVVTLL